MSKIGDRQVWATQSFRDGGRNITAERIASKSAGAKTRREQIRAWANPNFQLAIGHLQCLLARAVCRSTESGQSSELVKFFDYAARIRAIRERSEKKQQCGTMIIVDHAGEGRSLFQHEGQWISPYLYDEIQLSRFCSLEQEIPKHYSVVIFASRRDPSEEIEKAIQRARARILSIRYFESASFSERTHSSCKFDLNLDVKENSLVSKLFLQTSLGYALPDELMPPDEGIGWLHNLLTPNPLERRQRILIVERKTGAISDIEIDGCEVTFWKDGSPDERFLEWKESVHRKTDFLKGMRLEAQSTIEVFRDVKEEERSRRLGELLKRGALFESQTQPVMVEEYDGVVTEIREEDMIVTLGERDDAEERLFELKGIDRANIQVGMKVHVRSKITFESKDHFLKREKDRRNTPPPELEEVTAENLHKFLPTQDEYDREFAEFKAKYGLKDTKNESNKK